MKCPDCLNDGKNSTCVFDLKQSGEVCPRCHRVFSYLSATPDNKHYATKEGAMRAMKRDRDRRMHNSISTQTLVDRMLRHGD